MVEAGPHDQWRGGRGRWWGRGEGRVARMRYLRVGKGGGEWTVDLSVGKGDRCGPLWAGAAEDGEGDMEDVGEA